MFDLTDRKLSEAGYNHYEISNYARKNKQKKQELNNNSISSEICYACKHNLNYWRRGNYIGIGPAASSHIDGIRKTNISDIDEYIRRIESGTDPADETETLTDEQKLTESIYLGLRTSEGIDIKALSDEYSVDLRSLWQDELVSFGEAGLVRFDSYRLLLTTTGMWVSDMVVTSLLALL